MALSSTQEVRFYYIPKQCSASKNCFILFTARRQNICLPIRFLGQKSLLTSNGDAQVMWQVNIYITNPTNIPCCKTVILNMGLGWCRGRCNL